MLLITHIVLAFAGLGLMFQAVVLKWRESTSYHPWLVRLSGLSFIGLVATGTDLVITGRGQITGACVEGLLYAGCLAGLYTVYRTIADD